MTHDHDPGGTCCPLAYLLTNGRQPPPGVPFPHPDTLEPAFPAWVDAAWHAAVAAMAFLMLLVCLWAAAIAGGFIPWATVFSWLGLR